MISNIFFKQTPFGTYDDLPLGHIPDALVWWGGIPGLNVLDGTARTVYCHAVFGWAVKQRLYSGNHREFKKRVTQIAGCQLRGVESLTFISIPLAPIEFAVHRKIV